MLNVLFQISAFVLIVLVANFLVLNYQHIEAMIQEMNTSFIANVLKTNHSSIMIACRARQAKKNNKKVTELEKAVRDSVHESTPYHDQLGYKWCLMNENPR